MLYRLTGDLKIGTKRNILKQKDNAVRQTSFEVNFLRFSGSHIKTKGFWIGFFIKWISVLSMALKIKKRAVLSFIYGFLSMGLCFAGDQAEGIP